MNAILRVGKAVGRAQYLLATTILKLAPPERHKLTIESFDWGDFSATLKSIHFVYAALGIWGVVPMSLLLLRVPLLEFSIVGTLTLGIQTVVTQLLGIEYDVTDLVFFASVFLMILWRRDVGSIFGVGPNLAINLPGYAMREELMFRAGSEKWNVIEKIRACLCFGILHFAMLIVPIGVALALSFGGVVLMASYLMALRRTKSPKKAVKESATVHTLYNIMVLGLLLVFIIGALF